MVNRAKALWLKKAINVLFGLVVVMPAMVHSGASWVFAQEASASLGGLKAWMYFVQGEERYGGTPYYWLGRFNLQLNIRYPASSSEVLELLWGAKNDQREAVLQIGGQQIRLSAGGYDGFRWQRVPLPRGLPAEDFSVDIRAGEGKPAFLAAVRVVDPSVPVPEDIDGSLPREHLITLSFEPARPAAPPEAFPEKRSFWDQPFPAIRPRVAEPEVQAAFLEAELHARQANEQWFRCRKFLEGWVNEADPATGLIPRNLSTDRDIWNAADAAADNYPFMVLTAALTSPELFAGKMRELLETETRLTCRLDRLPDTWSFSRQGFRSEQIDLSAIIFGASEYTKDGLLPLTEYLGPSPWSDRLLGILDDIWKHAPIETPFGRIPSENVEINGEQLQVLCRMFWMTGETKYLDWAIRLGDYYLLGGNHPTRNMERVRLRDHGCEIISGLSELYLATHFARPEKKATYREAVHAMYDRILEIGRDRRGMLYNWINPQTGEHDANICDTWGYNYNGIYTVYLLDGRADYRDAVRHALRHLPELTEYHWGSADEYADSIEGAINLYNREPVEEARQWIDSEIRDMWRPQRPDGIIEGWHGDGNSARTAIMYALWKTQGITAQPWREDLLLGATRRGEKLFVVLSASSPWEGKICFDKPRHRQQMRLPIDYPRINQFPEWFTAEPGRAYSILDPSTGKKQSFSGEDLQRGIPMTLEPMKELRFVVQVQP